MYKKHIKNYSLVLLGTVAYCLGINLFIVPANLYNGGVMGIAQLLRTFFIQSLKLNIPASADLSGIIFFILNIPIMIIAYKDISRSFFVKTIVAVVVQTILLSAIPIPSEAIVSDITAASVTGAILCGFGTGITLLAGGSCGGTDTLGIFFAKRYRTLTVGKLSLFINIFIYLICSILFDFEIAIFSVFVSIVGNTVVDRLHAQNIMVTAMIFTHNHSLKNQIMSSLNRGTTYWNGYGGYTDKETDILVTAVSKYEIHTLRKIVRENDPKAFIIINQNISVLGNFEKRLS
mgnify:FL=1